jgi:plasmid stabilization system protein ParE
VIVHPTADAELAEAVSYYTAIDPVLGHRFYAEIQRLIREISDHPQTFRQFDPPARRHFSPRFPYGIIYLEQEERLWVVAVMHLKRRPGYWKARLE